MYRAPLSDLRFVLHELIGEEAIRAGGAFPDYSAETADAILEEAAKFAQSVLEPLEKSGDREGARWTPQGVVSPKGFKEAYRQYAEGGWSQLSAPEAFGGQNAPSVLATAVQEMWASANLAFKLCPMLTQGAIEALSRVGSSELQQRYIPKMVTGEWTGTMNLTETQAGSDLGAIRTRAVAEGDRYRIFGQKIFITYGDHDYTPNIIHMVLARIDGAPAGTRGISMFVVPKFLIKADGSIGEPNDVRCVSIEHKLGIHASPTCVLAYGDQGGAIGYLVGEANRGLEYMFIMMNAARLAVGLEGYAIAERAYQQALEWAKARVQGKPAHATEARAAIVEHPDVKRMLLTMRATTEAMRALGLYTAHLLDVGAHHDDAEVRAEAAARGDLLIPIVKAWSTENGVDLASLGIQVHGGMGFIEETGAAQYFRDVRITPIYEGTTGIQANDLIGRKLARDRGSAMNALLARMEADLNSASRTATTEPPIASALEGVATLREATRSLLASMAAQPAAGLAVAVPYLKLAGTVIGGWLMAKSAVIAAQRVQEAGADETFYNAKLASARFYAAHVAPLALAHARVVRDGAASVNEVEPELV